MNLGITLAKLVQAHSNNVAQMCRNLSLVCNA